MTASVTLDRPWIHEAANQANNHQFISGRPDGEWERPGETREYGERLRVVTFGVPRDGLSIVLVDVTAEQVEWLKGLAGDIVMYRDRYRLGFFTYFAVKPREYHGYNFAVQLALTEASFDVAV